jgi:quercetin dioxygenase-like cupin family protein
MNYVVTLDGKTLCGRAKPTPHQFGESMVRAIADGELEARECPLDHYFADDLYGRRIYCAANTVVTTQRHKTQHITVVLKGECTVYGGDGGTRHVAAPAVWITEPGTQRVVYCETDTEWLTVHANPGNVTDLDLMETILADDTLADVKARLLLEKPL